MKDTMTENKVNKIQELVWKYFSAMRLYQPNTNASLKMLGILLYLAKTKVLFKSINVSSNDHSILLYIDKNYVETFAGTMSSSWANQGISNMAICTRILKDKNIGKIVGRYINDFRMVSDPIYIFEIADHLVYNQLSSKDYIEILDFAIQQHMLESGRMTGECYQSKEMTQLVAFIIGSSCDTIFNPFAGLLSYATEIKSYSQFEAIEINRDIWELGMIRAALSDRIESISSTLGDVANWPKKKYDGIVLTPPFRIKIDMADSIFNSREFSETVAMSRFETSTTEKGVLLTYVPLSVLFSVTEEKLRQNLTAKGYVDTIIILPSGLMTYTNIPIALVVLRKKHSTNLPIRMLDASSLFTEVNKRRVLDVDAVLKALEASMRVSIADIEANQWSWNINAYKDVPERQHPGDFVPKKFGEIVDEPNLERHFDDCKGHVVKISDLSDSPYDYIKSPSEFPMTDDLRNTVKCIEPVLLLSTIRTLNPTFCKATNETPIFVSKNVAVFKLSDSDVDTGYLCTELADAQISSLGAYIPYFTRSSILRMVLYFPPTKDEQEKYFIARKKEYILSKAKEEGLQEVIDQMKGDYLNEIRTRKHDMMPHVRQVDSACKNIELYLSHRQEIGDNEFIQGIKEEVTNQKRAIKSLTTLLKIFSREEQFGTPEVINLDRFLTKHFLNGRNYTIDHITDYIAMLEYGINLPKYLKIHSKVYRVEQTQTEKSVLSDVGIDALILQKDGVTNSSTIQDYAEGINVLMAPDDLLRLCDNIVNNAVKHGFTDSSRKDYSIVSELTIDRERDMFRIDFRNNGTPIPKGLDKYRYGIRGEKAGNTAGNGEGGHIVKSIVEHYGGDYDIFSEKTENGDLTTVRIYLPIYRS